MKNNKSVLALFLEFHLRPLSLCHVATTLIKTFQSHFLFFLINFSFLIRSQQQRKKRDALRHLIKCIYKFSRVRSYLSIKVSSYSFVYSTSLQIEINKSLYYLRQLQNIFQYQYRATYCAKKYDIMLREKHFRWQQL